MKNETQKQKNSKTNKIEWQKPEVKVIDVKKTAGGAALSMGGDDVTYRS